MQHTKSNIFGQCLFLFATFPVPLIALEGRIRGLQRISRGHDQILPLFRQAEAAPLSLSYLSSSAVTFRAPTCSGFRELGCITDRTQQARVFYDVHVTKDEQKQMTSEVCYNFCRQVSGSRAFGFQTGRCFCSPFVAVGQGQGRLSKGPGDWQGQNISKPSSKVAPAKQSFSEGCTSAFEAFLYQMHDCDVVPVKCFAIPPPVANSLTFQSNAYGAPTACKNYMDTFGDNGQNSKCELQCQPGYEVLQNDMSCISNSNGQGQKWGSFVGWAACTAKSCGVPQCVNHAQYSTAEVVYPNSVLYRCQTGYSIDGRAGSPRSFLSTCTVNGVFTNASECLPIQCGTAPSDSFASVLSAGSVSDGRHTFGMVTKYTCFAGYSLDATAAGPTSYSRTCEATGNFSAAPSCQAVSCGPAPAYSNAHVRDFKSKQFGKAPKSKFFREVASYMMTVTYECNEGFSTDARPVVPQSDNKFFTSKCMAEGVFSVDVSLCLPISCGPPEPINNAVMIPQHAFVSFQQKVSYTCDAGYTLNGTSDGETSFKLTCGSDGNFTSPLKACQAVTCGNTPSPGNASVAQQCNGLCRYPMTLQYGCSPGHSTLESDDPTAFTSDSFSITCQPTGQFTNAATCINVDNCVEPFVKNCSWHGQCVDHMVPTGNADLDWHCMCDAGFESVSVQRSNTSARDEICKNINDCPGVDSYAYGCGSGGEASGECVDLLKGYQCSCSPGFEEIKLTGMENTTCVPMTCGPVIAIPYASYIKPAWQPMQDFTKKTLALFNESDIVFAHPPVTYQCNAGFTLSGVAGDNSTFKLSCDIHGTGVAISPFSECKPVSCGRPWQVNHSFVTHPADDVSQMFYAEEMMNRTMIYSCLLGYTTDALGKYIPDASFKVECLANGNKTLPRRCVPVACGTPPSLAHGSPVSNQSLSYLQSADYNCDYGYSIDGTTNPDSFKFQRTCQANGNFSKAAQCQPVKCGKTPVVEHAGSSMSGFEMVHGDVAVYTTDRGFTLDGNASGNTTFLVTCLPTGNFKGLHTVQPVKCGSPLLAPNSVWDKRERVFGDTVKYICKFGFSTDGNPVHMSARGGQPGSDLQMVKGGPAMRISLLRSHQASGRQLLEDPSMTKGNGSAEAPGRQLLKGPPMSKVKGMKGKPLFSPRLTGFGNGVFSSICQADGTYARLAKSCEPVKCNVDALPKARLANASLKPSERPGESDFSFTSPARFECNPGYTFNGFLNGSVDFSLTCLHNGVFTDPPKCLNVDDCIGSICGRDGHGKCIDNPTPSSLTFHNYQCQCDSGFTADILEKDGVKLRYCKNIDDCPKTACHLGKCEDLINGYRCHCPSGTYAAPNLFNNLSMDCHKQKCTMPQVPQYTENKIDITSLSVFVGEVATYKCLEGYSLTGKANGNRTLTVECLAGAAGGKSGNFSAMTSSCLPISCGAPDAKDNAKRSTSDMLTYDQVVTYTCNTGYSTDKTCDPLGANKAFNMTCGADGKFKSSGKGTKCLAVLAGLPSIKSARYTRTPMHFPEAKTVFCEEGYSTDGVDAQAKSFEVIAQANCSIAQPYECTIMKCGRAPNISYMTPSKDGVVSYNEKVVYKAVAGYTLNGQVGGTAEITMSCGASGNFTSVDHLLPIKPIRCKGSLPNVTNAVADCSELMFSEVARYTCNFGYSLDGLPAAMGAPNRDFSVTCLADGSYTAPSECKPVQCPPPPNVSNAKLHGSSRVVFPGKAKYACNPGWSLDAVLNGKQDFEISCMANGSYQAAPVCKNMKDCVGTPCSGHGDCIEHPSPTGDHLSDYHCKCSTGYEPLIKEVNGTKYHACGDVMDCPPGACFPGSCIDLVNTYACTCPEGYFVSKNIEKNLPSDCLPQSCGMPRRHDNAWFSGGEERFYLQTVKYTCNDGYTLDGALNGDKSFNATCDLMEPYSETTSVQYSSLPECKPVTCGTLTVEHASKTQTSLLFNETVDYTCHDGYTTTGQCSGARKFTMLCTSSGVTVNIDKNIGHRPCKPVSAGVPDLPFSIFTKEEMFYPDHKIVSCKGGYSTKSDDPNSTTFELRVLPNCSFAWHPMCEPVSCGKPPIMPNVLAEKGEVDVVFPNTVMYKTAMGYTDDGSATGAMNFSVACNSRGKLEGFAKYMPVLPVSCGVPKDIPNAAHSDDARTFGQSVEYTCKNGFSTDGRPSGNSNTMFNVTCEATGKFSTMQSCSIVRCGRVPSLANAKLSHSLSNLSEFVFNQSAPFQCMPGWSLDGKLGGQIYFEVKCNESGLFTPAPMCLNMDDCEGITCGGHGTCEDLPLPSGVHLNDYKCICESGYVWNNVSRVCENKNDCFEGACQPGTCKDLINSFRCECPFGYYSSANSSCRLQTCRAPVMHHVQIVNPRLLGQPFSSNEVREYQCDVGYSLDGANSGANFNVSCMGNNLNSTDGDLSGVSECIPVSCEILEINNATPSKLALNYSDEVLYMCDAGYSTHGTCEKDSNASFAMKCTASGDLVYIDQHHSSCEPNFAAVPTAEMLPNAEFTLGVPMKFPMRMNVTCKTGYSTDEHDHKLTDLELVTTPFCGFDKYPKCNAVSCGIPPANMSRARLNNSVVEIYFGMAPLSYDCIEGHSLSGVAGEIARFDLTCSSNGTFIGWKECKPVSCGAPPYMMPIGAKAPNLQKIPSMPRKTISMPRKMISMPTQTFPMPGKTISMPRKTISMPTQTFPMPGKTISMPRKTISMPTKTFPMPGKTTSMLRKTFSMLNTKGFSAEQRTSTTGIATSTSRSFEIPSMSGSMPGNTFKPKTTFSMPTKTLSMPTKTLSMPNPKLTFSVPPRTFPTPRQVGSQALFHFGEQVSYECPIGTSLDGSPAAPKKFKLTCGNEGRFLGMQQCKPITCPMPVNRKNSTPVVLQSLQRGYTTLIQTNCLGGSRSQCSESECPVHCDKDEHCTGFSCRMGAKSCFTKSATCTMQTADWSIHFQKARLSYNDPVRFRCQTGYSINALPPPSGEIEYMETCQSDGTVSQTTDCQDIDYCKDISCGEGGTCQDGLLGYSCICSPGYQVGRPPLVLRPVCVPIDECDIWDGRSHCGPNGECIDGLSRFTCKCNTGYDVQNVGASRQKCVAKVCGSVPDIDYAERPPNLDKVAYPTKVPFRCEDGYTTNGAIGGDTKFVLACQADATFLAIAESSNYSQELSTPKCLPVACPIPLPIVPHASVVGGPLFFKSPSANYTCDEGYTDSGDANGSTSFTVSCTQSGQFTETAECRPIRCGSPPDVPNSVFNDTERIFNEKTMYTCEDGHTIDGTATGPTSFEVKCQVSGNFTEVEACSPINCGRPPFFKHAEETSETKVYNEVLQVICKTGFYASSGGSSFNVRCLNTGMYETSSNCLRVSCGVPSSSKYATPENSVEAFYNDSVTWICQDKFSANGLPDGPTTFSRTCEADGTFLEASLDCQDVDFCYSNPCGLHGTCADCTQHAEKCIAPSKMSKIGATSKSGVPLKGNKPGFLPSSSGVSFKSNGDYACSCHKGYEITEENGTLRCTQDVCFGNGCGSGGTCIDLSKFGIKGAYDCICDSGYIRIGQGAPRCEPILCSPEPPTYNNSKGKHIPGRLFAGGIGVFAFDSIEYQCDPGYSTDGSPAMEKTRFTIQCSSAGLLVNVQECKKIECDASQLSRTEIAANAKVVNSNGNVVFKYGDRISFNCNAGYELDALQGSPQLKGPAFSKTQGWGGSPQLKGPAFTKAKGWPGPPQLTFPVGKTSGQAGFPLGMLVEQSVENSLGGVEKGAYSPLMRPPGLPGSPFGQLSRSPLGQGYPKNFVGPGFSKTGGAFPGKTFGIFPSNVGSDTFNIQCQADGTFSAAKHCKRKSCGIPPFQKQAVASVQTPVFSLSVVIYRCKTGHFTTSGNQSFIVNCGIDGNFKQQDFQDCYPVRCDDNFYFGQTRKTYCPRGSTLNGIPNGLAYFQETCNKDGLISRPEGLSTCKPVMYKVDGVVSDAKDAQRKLRGAKIAITKRSDSAKSCTDLGWPDVGLEGVCGQSSSTCGMGRSLQSAAQAHCSSLGARLCMHFEISKGETCRSGCDLDDKFVWTSTPCSGGFMAVRCNDNSAECLPDDSGYSGRCCADVNPENEANVDPLTVTADSLGAYSAQLTSGVYVLNASAAGFIDNWQELIVQSNIKGDPGPADITLSELMTPERWRLVLTWERLSRDLDSWLSFGSQTVCNTEGCFGPCITGWSQPHDNCRYDSINVQATLERDFTKGFGPETTYIDGVGNCKKSVFQDCIIVFMVRNYSPESAAMGESGAKVTVFKGKQSVTTLGINANVGSRTWWPVLTIDASDGSWYAGDHTKQLIEANPHRLKFFSPFSGDYH